MKNTKLIIATLGVCAAGLIAAQPALAAETFPKETDTKGTITFGVDEINEEDTTVPDEKGDNPTEIILDPDKDGTETKTGSLRLQFVPHFNFGTYNGFTAKEAKKYVEVIGYSETAGGARKDMAPFVQVAEFRGEGVWSLEVKATEFVNTKKADDILTGAHINLPGSTLTMERHTSEQAKDYFKGQKDGAATIINTDPTGGATHIMESIEGKTVTGFKVSNVFHNNYTKGMSYEKDEAAGVAAKESAGVEFVKPKGVVPVKDAVYQSTLTWTLANTL